MFLTMAEGLEVLKAEIRERREAEKANPTTQERINLMLWDQRISGMKQALGISTMEELRRLCG